MLVLSRKPGQSIVIDERIVVTVVKMGNGAVRLGIDAPREIPVRRAEKKRDDHKPADAHLPETIRAIQ